MNAVKCVHCLHIVESKIRHNFVPHYCNVWTGDSYPDNDFLFAVHGGRAYKRRVGDPRHYIEVEEKYETTPTY